MQDYVTETVDGPLHVIGSPPLLQPGTVLDGRYRITRVLGHGGSAVVYAARDLKLNADIAVKMLRADRVTESAIKRLRREVTIARRAADPRLIRMFDIVESEQGTYLTMELVDAPTLSTCMRGRPLDVEEVIRIGREVLSALTALHEMDIVHRDLKPSNILIAGDGSIKLGDFGLALHLTGDESRLTQTASLVGTFEYLSPEQALGLDVDQRSDLYSFGVLLFEMLTGRVPFDSESSIAAVIARVNRNAPDVRTFRADAPRWLAGLIGTLLEKEPARRFDRAEDVGRALDRRRVPLRRALPWLRIVIVGSILALTFTAGVLTWYMHRFERVINDGAMTITAIDRRGRPLWTMSGVNQPSNVATVRQGGTLRYVAVVKDRGIAADLPRNHELLLIDAQSGAVARRVHLPDYSVLFPEFSPEFHISRIGSADLEGLGDDLVIITYCHAIYWPSYTVIYDIRAQRQGTLFIGSGQHHYAGVADVNGDGRKDVLLTGINNRMGYSVAVAAIDGRRLGADYNTASSPDAVYVTSGARALLWYALLPSGGPARTIINERARTIAVEYSTGRVQTIGFDGYPVGSYKTPAAVRDRFRAAAYEELRESHRLAAGGFVKDAVESARRAAADATRSEDPYLAEWAGRSHAQMLIQAGRLNEAGDEFERALRSSASPSEVAFDAARTFHLHGALAQAAAWYHRGLGQDSTGESGRGRYEFVEGEVLALGELGRWDDAMAAARQYAAEFREWPYAPAFEQYVRWRRGERIETPVDVTGTTTDLVRYWNLEIRYRNGMQPSSLLREIDLERSHASGQTLLLSLRSQVLSQLGRTSEAYRDALTSFDSALAARATNTEIRSHFDLIAARYIRLARATGHDSQARQAESQVRRIGLTMRPLT